MTIRLHKPQGIIQGQIILPGSKSISNRVLMIKAISGWRIAIEHLSESDDTHHLLKALGDISNGEPLVDIGHAGTDMRFLTAYIATRVNAFCELTGSERMQQRPIGELVEALKSLGADISYTKQEGYPPLSIRGKQMEGGKGSITGSVSSQFISALLLVAPLFKYGLTLEITGNVVSKPYIRMTIGIMKHFGVHVFESGGLLVVRQKYYQVPEGAYVVEADWSAASYFYSIIALSPLYASLKLNGLIMYSLQPDSACVTIFERFGVETIFEEEGILIRKRTQPVMDMLEYDFTDCPDIAQTLACTCVGLQVPFHFTGLQTLKVKETDRITALQQEFKKFGVRTGATESSLSYDGRSALTKEPVLVSTYNDHRMAMSFAPLALVHDAISIENHEVVSKSYLNFWHDLYRIGLL